MWLEISSAVIIVTKGRRPQVIVFPIQILNDFIDKHILRRGLSRRNINTILVKKRILGEWKKEPSVNEVINILDETLENSRVKEGEFRYRLLEHLFEHIKMRVMNFEGAFITEAQKGDFVINVTKINGRAKKVINELRKDNKVSGKEEEKIKNIYSGLENEITYFVTHLHVASER